MKPVQALMLAIALAAALLVMAGCRDSESQAAAVPAEVEETPPPTNRIDVPATVRQNLGITFAQVEQRQVANMIRVPGQFELLPSARREYRATLPGWIALRIDQYDDVEAGTVLWQLDSPEWHALRKQLHESQAAIARVTAELAVTEQAKAEAEQAVAILQERVDALAGAEVRRAELEAELAIRRGTLPRLESEIQVKLAALDEARHDFALDVDMAASLLGLSVEHLTQTVEAEGAGGGDDEHEHHKVQRWFAISRVDYAAAEPGVVEALHATSGTWVEANTLVATVIDPAAIRFRATGLQSDLGRLRDGLVAQVVPPQGSSIADAQVLTGELMVGLVADPNRRTVELLMMPETVPAWARPGVSAMLEIVAEGSGGNELAIPVSAVVRDGLIDVFFRRDPNDADKVIRVEADLGISDGKWVVVNSGVKAGDEIVLDGVYELNLASAGNQMGGGHFHADGTWHADPD